MLRDEPIYQQFVNDFSKELYNLPGKFSNLVFFCIGTDRITGDSFGPLVGYKLDYLFHQLNPQITIEVVGNLERPVCASNVEQEIQRIYYTYPHPCVVAIDAALSGSENIGKILVQRKSMNIGKSLDKKLITIGDISIKGIVARNYKMVKHNLETLQNTPLGLVMNLADITSKRNL